VLPDKAVAPDCNVPDDDMEIINLAISMGVTVEDLRKGNIDSAPTAEVAWKYVHGQPLVSPQLERDLPTQMRRLHDWYLHTSKKGLSVLNAKYKSEHYFSECRIQIEFEELFQLYNQDALDISILSCYCL